MAKLASNQTSPLTYPIHLHFTAVVANHLKNLLDLFEEAWVENGLRQLDVAEMAWTLSHRLGACFAPELSIDGSEKGIVQSSVARLDAQLVHGLRVDDVAHAHVLDLFRSQDAKLDLLYRLYRRARVREV